MMGKNGYHKIPNADPVGGGPLYVSELTGAESGVVIRGQFALPRFAALDEEQTHFLETFLRCRGMISSVEKELNLSYPTVRARLDSLLSALGLAPAREDGPRREKLSPEGKREILEQLERGEITATEAKERVRGAK